jgi:hypothetical protein
VPALSVLHGRVSGQTWHFGPVSSRVTARSRIAVAVAVAVAVANTACDGPWLTGGTWFRTMRPDRPPWAARSIARLANDLPTRSRARRARLERDPDGLEGALIHRLDRLGHEVSLEPLHEAA